MKPQNSIFKSEKGSEYTVFYLIVFDLKTFISFKRYSIKVKGPISISQNLGNGFPIRFYVHFSLKFGRQFSSLVRHTEHADSIWFRMLTSSESMPLVYDRLKPTCHVPVALQCCSCFYSNESVWIRG